MWLNISFPFMASFQVSDEVFYWLQLLIDFFSVITFSKESLICINENLFYMVMLICDCQNYFMVDNYFSITHVNGFTFPF